MIVTPEVVAEESWGEQEAAQPERDFVVEETSLDHGHLQINEHLE